MQTVDSIYAILLSLTIVVCVGCDKGSGNSESTAPDAGTSDTTEAGGGDADRDTVDTRPSDVLADGAEQWNCSPSGEHIESREMSNNAYLPDVGTPESSSITLGPGTDSRVISGCFSPTEANEATLDDDFYAFEVTDAVRVRASMSWTGPAERHALAILNADRSPATWWSIANTQRLSSAAVELDPGRYLLHASASTSGATSAYTYEIALEVDPSPCRSTTGTADHREEESDGSSHRDNDSAAVVWQPYPASSPAEPESEPERTGLTLEAGSTRSISGRSVDIETAGDSYLDRDAFHLETGDSVQELTVVLENSEDKSNLDAFVFSADRPGEMRASGVSLEAGAGEQLRVPVDSNQEYWIWVAGRDWGSLSPGLSSSMRGLPADYRVTVCAE